MDALVLFAILLGGLPSSTAAQQSPSKCSPEAEAVVSVAAVLNIFKDAKDSFWPGFDLSSRPFLFYSAGRWNLLINATSPLDGFQPFQLGDSPSLQLHCGSLEGLAGQLELNYRLGKETAVAIPFVSRDVAPRTQGIVNNIVIIVHEAFHQFQRGRFVDIPSRSEDEYPILNEENNALASLEMRILADAVSEEHSGRTGLWRKSAAMFVAVRERRLQAAPKVVREMERAKEFDEGTAYYVEVRSIERMASLCSTRRASGVAAQACTEFASLDGPAYLMKAFGDLFQNGALRPDNVARNRLYPVGAAMGFLLDALKADWKTKVMRATADYTLAGQLRVALGIRAVQYDQLVREAKARYHFDEILLATRRLIQEYQEEYRAAIARFEVQRGVRVEVEVPIGGSGSRASRNKRYVVDAGARVFCSEYSVYTLRQRAAGSLSLLIQKAGVLEESAPRGARRLTFFSTITSLMIDGRTIDISKPGTWEFRQLALAGQGFSLETDKPGLLTISPNKISVVFADSVR